MHQHVVDEGMIHCDLRHASVIAPCICAAVTDVDDKSAEARDHRAAQCRSHSLQGRMLGAVFIDQRIGNRHMAADPLADCAGIGKAVCLAESL